MSLSPVDGLRCPPFGLGTNRRVTDHRRGVTSTGIPYQGFDYTSSMYDEYAGVATVRLGICLPPFFVSLPENPRADITGVQIPNQVGVLAVASDGVYGQTVLDGSLAAIREFARHRALDLAIDGDSLTAVQVPLDPKELHAYCEDMAMVASTINRNDALRRFAIPREPGSGFYGFPGWLYVERDDRLLAGAPVTWAGTGHAAIHAVVQPPSGNGLQAIGFTHWYQTSSTDSDGNSQTSTHKEHLVSLRLPFVFGALGFDWRGLGDPIMLFAPQLEQHHQISAVDNQFVADVVRPIVNWLAHLSPPRFAIQGSGMWFSLGQEPTPKSVQWCSEFAAQLFERVGNHVWNRLGYPSNPLTLDLR